MTKKILIAIGAVVLLVLAFLAGRHVSGPTVFGDSSTSFPNGITVGGGTYAIAPAFAVTGAETVSTTLGVTGASTLTGAVYAGSDITRGGIISTTTSTAASTTLQQSDLVNITTISVNPNLVSGFTATLPASSTLTTYVSSAGDTDSISVVNSTTTGMVYITLVGGTGTFLQSTASTSRIYPGVSAQLICTRKVSTDVICNLVGN